MVTLLLIQAVGSCTFVMIPCFVSSSSLLFSHSFIATGVRHVFIATGMRRGTC